MERHTGTMDFDYFGRRITIDYAMTNLGGSPHIYIRDKNGSYHTFFHQGSWQLSGNYTLKWPADFMAVLFAAFDIERERWGL
ncbi:MAG TPA: hypothetical protein VNQ80_12340 [Parapedobacter sp.]|uniref:hypothetical protein n=1 Tax=Parapedobacter sp. TaxID=1958893 RepID=UPI002CF373AB|nr:hypothetical protein [Parapedobacter sp.]HWK58126.1 hypothetical protein [Parapedobacter sp.]